jgi:hypothetical protein
MRTLKIRKLRKVWVSSLPKPPQLENLESEANNKVI